MKSIKKLLFIGLFIYIPFSSMAWGLLGHRIVGQIADSYLTRHTQKEIYKILGTESVAMASNWPDFIKADPAFSYLSPWHYINLKAGLDAAAVKAFLDADTAIDAYTKVNFLVTQLKNKDLAHESQVLYLRLLIHIVGDLHQPLHVGRLDDLGGNKIKVLWFKDSVNLHQVWDERIINFQQLSYTEYAGAINFTTKEQRQSWQAEPVSEWIWQGYQLAEKIYSDIKPNQKLEYRYNFDYLSIVNQQLLKGGVHLAGLLNEIFG
jgi:hypothetical protein